MLGFLPTVIGVTIFAKLIKLSLPEGGSLKRYVSVFIGICITAVMIIPIADLLTVLGEGLSFDIDIPSADDSDYGEIFEDGIAENLIPSVEEYLYRQLSERFGVAREDCDVTIEFDTSGDVIALRRITLFLKNNARFKDTGTICRFFEEQLECVVDVSVDIP